MAIDPLDTANGASIDVQSHGDIVEITVPSGISFMHPAKLQWGKTAKTSLAVHVEKNARLILLEQLGMNTSHACHVSVDEGANIEFICMNRAGVPIEIRQTGTVGDNAMIRWKNITLSAGAVDHHLESELTGADALSSIDWMFYAKNDEKYQFNARNVFTGRHGSGEITMKGVAEDRGHVRCSGKIEIGVGGGGTDTYLTQDVLMLDKTAKVDAVPGLEIKTNDVKASHSATVSRVTDEDLFYFAARGIIEKEAKRMFVEGFLGEMVGKIGDAAAREEILASVGEKYGI